MFPCANDFFFFFFASWGLFPLICKVGSWNKTYLNALAGGVLGTGPARLLYDRSLKQKHRQKQVESFFVRERVLQTTRWKKETWHAREGRQTQDLQKGQTSYMRQ